MNATRYDRPDFARDGETVLELVTQAVRAGDDSHVKTLDRKLRILEREPAASHDGPVGPHWTKVSV